MHNFDIFNRYYQTIDDLIDFFSNIHSEVNLPSVIAIDSLNSYIESDKCEQVKKSPFVFTLLNYHYFYRISIKFASSH